MKKRPYLYLSSSFGALALLGASPLIVTSCTTQNNVTVPSYQVGRWLHASFDAGKHSLETFMRDVSRKSLKEKYNFVFDQGVQKTLPLSIIRSITFSNSLNDGWLCLDTNISLIRGCNFSDFHNKSWNSLVFRGSRILGLVVDTPKVSGSTQDISKIQKYANKMVSDASKVDLLLQYAFGKTDLDHRMVDAVFPYSANSANIPWIALGKLNMTVMLNSSFTFGNNQKICDFVLLPRK